MIPIWLVNSQNIGIKMTYKLECPPAEECEKKHISVRSSGSEIQIAIRHINIHCKGDSPEAIENNLGNKIADILEQAAADLRS